MLASAMPQIFQDAGYIVFRVFELVHDVSYPRSGIDRYSHAHLLRGSNVTCHSVNRGSRLLHLPTLARRCSGCALGNSTRVTLWRTFCSGTGMTASQRFSFKSPMAQQKVRCEPDFRGRPELIALERGSYRRVVECDDTPIAALFRDLFFGSDAVPRGTPRYHRGLLEISVIFNKHGWYWGAGFSNPDSMHFELAEETVRKTSKTANAGDGPRSVEPCSLPRLCRVTHQR